MGLGSVSMRTIEMGEDTFSRMPLGERDECGTTLGQFHRDRDGEVARARAQDEQRRERDQQYKKRQREVGIQEDALRRERKALLLERKRRRQMREMLNK